MRAYYHRLTHSDASRAMVISMGCILLITGRRLFSKHKKKDWLEAAFALGPMALAGLWIIPPVATLQMTFLD